MEYPEKISLIQKLLDSQEFNEACDLANEVASDLEKNLAENKVFEYYYKIGCLLIDIGSEGYIRSAIDKGISILSKHHDVYRKCFTDYSLEYNLGNGKKSLFDIDRRQNPDNTYRLGNAKLLTESKNHYWRSLKHIPDDHIDDFLQLYVNLANTLNISSRISEALYYYDKAIETNSEFSPAYGNKSLCLTWLNDLSNSASQKLFLEIYLGYENAVKYADSNSYQSILWQNYLENSKKVLLQLKVDIDKEKDDLESLNEFNQLDSYRKFTLENYLSLSEHGLYCWCDGSARDNLTIPQIEQGLYGDYIPKMELILNHLKSEYNFSRVMLYETINSMFNDYADIDHQACFTDLMINDLNGLHIEKIRQAFKSCFSMLDKIAKGICELYKLSKPKENIYFESFWKNNPDRWSKINEIVNPGLFGLYSIATDLNSNNGEWAEFKKWRNSIEHGILIVKHNDDNIDPFNSTNFNSDITITNIHNFIASTKQLMQLVRSAIFCFVFCVRSEAKVQSEVKSNNTQQIKLNRKDFRSN
jgi:hypothetical protein